MYVTKQGECWDQIAKNVYGSEKYAGQLMEENMELLDTTVFGEGQEIRTTQAKEGSTGMPPWREKA